MGALDKQIGGNHYKEFNIQPVEFIHRNDLGFEIGNVIKYVCRYKNTFNMQDLEKAKHYLELMIELSKNSFCHECGEKFENKCNCKKEISEKNKKIDPIGYCFDCFEKHKLSYMFPERYKDDVCNCDCHGEKL